MAKVYVDSNRYTCISYVECDGIVLAVKNQEPELGLLEMGSLEFHSQWTEIAADPKKAAAQYRDGFIPFNPEVSEILESIIMATKAKTPAASKAGPVVTTDGEGNVKAPTPKTKKAAPKAADAAPAPKGKKPSAAAEAKAKAFFDKAEKAVGAKTEGEEKPAKAAKAPKEPKAAKEPRVQRVPREDISDKKLVLLPAAEGKRFNEGSIRSQCFAKIKNGMTVKAYLAAVTKAEICDEAAAIGCLKKLTEVNQKTQPVAFEE